MRYQIWLKQSTVTHPAVCHDKVVNQQFAACSGLPHDDNHLTSIRESVGSLGADVQYMQYLTYNFTINMLTAYLSAQSSSLSAFMISKTRIVAQMSRGRQLNAKVCSAAIFLNSSLFRPLSSNDNSKTAQVLPLILARNWCSSQCAASQPLSVFTGSTLPWSK